MLDVCPCRLGVSNGRTCVCPSLPRPWSVRDGDRWMDRQTDRLGWQLRSLPWPRSLHTLGLCSLTGGCRQMAGPGGPCGHQMLWPTCWKKYLFMNFIFDCIGSKLRQGDLSLSHVGFSSCSAQVQLPWGTISQNLLKLIRLMLFNPGHTQAATKLQLRASEL